MSDELNQTILCNECQAGKMHQRYLTYFTWLGSQLITVPDFPAWVCDVCGKREFDPQATQQLTQILKPINRSSAGRQRTARPRPQSKKPARPSRSE